MGPFPKDYHNNPMYRTDRPEQTVSTQISMAFYQDLQCLLLISKFLDILTGSKMDLFKL